MCPRHFEKTTFGRICIGQSPVRLVGDLNPTVFARRHDAAIYYHATRHAGRIQATSTTREDCRGRQGSLATTVGFRFGQIWGLPHPTTKNRN